MIITVEELRQYISTDEGDQALEGRLQALELLIRGYTNNNFQVHGTGRIADVVGGTFMVEVPPDYEVGDTVQISGSEKNNGLYTVKEMNGETFRVNERTRDEIDLYVTRIEYPADVKMGVVNLLKWELNFRDKADIASESISRHTINYQALDAENTVHGYPAHLMGFLKPYMKARFGQGIRV